MQTLVEKVLGLNIGNSKSKGHVYKNASHISVDFKKQKSSSERDCRGRSFGLGSSGHRSSGNNPLGFVA